MTCLARVGQANLASGAHCAHFDTCHKPVRDVDCCVAGCCRSCSAGLALPAARDCSATGCRSCVPACCPCCCSASWPFMWTRRLLRAHAGGARAWVLLSAHGATQTTSPLALPDTASLSRGHHTPLPLGQITPLPLDHHPLALACSCTQHLGRAIRCSYGIIPRTQWTQPVGQWHAASRLIA